jgi:hypothetical protein
MKQAKLKQQKTKWGDVYHLYNNNSSIAAIAPAIIRQGKSYPVTSRGGP